MKELYEAINKLEIAKLKKKILVDANEKVLTFIDDLSAHLSETESGYAALKKEEVFLKEEIKILELVYFCKNGSYPDER